MTPRILIVAYGNPLRSDDGIAWRAAELLRRRFSPRDTEIICVHQLMPELAESVSQFRCAILLDARQDGEPGTISWARIGHDAESSASSHRLTPAQLLALCRVLYGVQPVMYAVSATGESFAHGEELSHRLQCALPQIVALVEQLARQIRRAPQVQNVSGAAESWV